MEIGFVTSILVGAGRQSVQTPARTGFIGTARKDLRAYGKKHSVKRSRLQRDVRCDASEGGKDDSTALDSTGKAKELALTYGPAFFLTSSVTSAFSFSMWYLAIKSGVDVRQLLLQVGDWLAMTPIGRPAVIEQISPSVGTFALAYVAHKASSPIRFPIVVACTPYIANIIKKKTQEKETKV